MRHVCFISRTPAIATTQTPTKLAGISAVLAAAAQILNIVDPLLRAKQQSND